MSTIHFKQATTATPEQYVAGLTDFGPGRAKLFGNSADDQLKVHSESAHHADVTEGSGGAWERLDYDWSDPHRVVARTTDSNAWGGHSGHTYTFTRRPDGTTDIDYVVVREGKNLKGRFLGVVLGSVGKRVLSKAFANSVRRSRRATPRRPPSASSLTRSAPGSWPWRGRSTRWALRSSASVLTSYFQIGSYSFAAGRTTYPSAQTLAPNRSP